MSIAPAKNNRRILDPAAKYQLAEKEDNKSKVQDVTDKPVVTKVLQAFYL